MEMEMVVEKLVCSMHGGITPYLDKCNAVVQNRVLNGKGTKRIEGKSETQIVTFNVYGRHVAAGGNVPQMKKPT